MTKHSLLPLPLVMPMVLVSLAAVHIPPPIASAQHVGSTRHTQIAGGPLHAYVGEVTLPADGIWTAKLQKQDDSIRELYLMTTQSTKIRQLGKRMYAAMEKKDVRSNRWKVQMGYEACRQFAQDGNGVGPASIKDLGTGTKRWNYVADNWNGKPRISQELQGVLDADALKGPYVHLIPEVKFALQDPKPNGNARETNQGRIRQFVAKKDRLPLAFSLRPIIDDGKHWVLYTDGSCEREPINEGLVALHNVDIAPMLKRDTVKQAIEQPTSVYKLVVVSEERITGSLGLSAYNQILDSTQTLEFDASTSADVVYGQLEQEIDQARKTTWRQYGLASSGVIDVWNQSTAASGDERPRRDLSLFSILGGRAAIEETLQLQNLTVTNSKGDGSVHVDSLKGVEVKSHPFSEMLDGDRGGELEMARYVPADRFFVYIGKPESITAMLDKGAPFISTIGTALSGNCLHYNMESRYLARLGMTRDWVDIVLKSGLTSEMSLFTPDLFFIDGTDVTIVAKLREPELLAKLVGMLGSARLDGSTVLELPTTTGDPAYLALRDDLLFASTNRVELEKSLELHQQNGSGSLGDSDEFRYMLTQLPVNEETRIYAYMSDPFVRRLVSPRVKIAQRRRVLAKAKMEALTGRAMLARLDGHTENLDRVVRTKYLPQTWQAENMTVAANGLVSSEVYGTLPEMETLPNVPIEQISPEEAESYKRYQENYSRYWRRFFDPIAVRLDEVGSDQLELSTFILPLVDNSIYNQLRDMLAHQDDKTTLAVPVVQPKPVVQFSMNLKDEAWQMIAGNFSEFFRRYSGASSAMLDDFGPSVHVAIFDADPIIAVGSGDIFGAFGGNAIGGRNDMVMIPIVLSMLTRPCSIMVETSSPERTAQYLRQAALANTSVREDQFLATSFYQVEDLDQWVWTADIFGMVKLRYGVEVVDNYLVIRNIPWSSDDRVVSTEPAELNAAVLTANPSACKEQLPGLFAAASDGNRRAVMSGLGRLYPFMLSGAASVEQATTEHQRLFGFYPKLLPHDEWNWTDFQLTSKDYGEPMRQRQPSFDPQKPFGLMNRIDFLQLNMQFEQDGLRSMVRWRLR